MTYTSGQIYDMLLPLPFGSAVLCQDSHGAKFICIRSTENGRCVILSEPEAQYGFSRGSESRADRTPISAIKPEGFFILLGKRSPFNLQDY